MDAIDCIDVETDSGKRGDEHYRDFGIWVRSRMSPEFLQTAQESAIAYEAALVLLVECLTAHDPTPRLERKIEAVLVLQALIVKDLEMISKHRKGFAA